jgi:hypothetical protein
MPSSGKRRRWGIATEEEGTACYAISDDRCFVITIVTRTTEKRGAIIRRRGWCAVVVDYHFALGRKRK